MTRIPTPIPQHWVGRARDLVAGSGRLTVWRLALLTVGLVAIYLMATSSVFLVSFLGATALGFIIADDLKATLVDVWNFDFWVWRVDA